MYNSGNIVLETVPLSAWFWMKSTAGPTLSDQLFNTTMPQQIQQLQPEDIEHALEGLYPLVYRFVVSMTWGSGLDPEDLTQDVFLKAYRNTDSFKGDSKVSTWVYRIARNTVLDALRKKKFRSYFAVLTSEGKQNPVEVAEHPDAESQEYAQQEFRMLIRQSVAELPEPFRSIVVWREIEDLSYAEIAEITGESEGTLKSRLFYARKKLRAILISKGLHYEIES